MKNFILSAFSDEANSCFEKQIEALKRNGIEYMEIRGVNDKSIADLTLEEVQKIKNQLDLNKIKVSAIGSPIGKISIIDDFLPHLKTYEHILEIAKILDTNYIRMFSFFIPEGDNPDIYRDEVIERWKQFIEIAKNKDVILLHENEKDIFGDTIDRCLDLLSTLDCDFVRLTFDPANFIQCNQEVYPRAYNQLKKYIEYFHIKDALYENHQVVPAGMGDGKIKEILKVAKAENYKGFVSVEPHLSSFSGLANLEKRQVEIKENENSEDKFDLAIDALKDILSEMKYN